MEGIYNVPMNDLDMQLMWKYWLNSGEAESMAISSKQHFWNVELILNFHIVLMMWTPY